MIETSKDLLFVVIAFCVLWLTIFLCWAVYYCAMILRQFNQMIKDFRDKLGKIDEALSSIRQKVEHSASYLGVIVQGMEKVGDYLKERKGKKDKKK